MSGVIIVGTGKLGPGGTGGGGGAVDSVNGHTGTVVLAAADVGAETTAGAQAKVDAAVAALKNGVAAGGDTLFELDARIAVVEALGSLATDAELIAAVAALIGSADTAGDTLGELQSLIGLRLLKSANLSDLANAGTARTNLGLGTAATTAATAYATAAQGATADAALPKLAGGAAVENIGSVESNVNTVAATGSTEALDTSIYGVHDCTMDQSCTFSFTNPAPSGKCSMITVILRGAFTPTWPAAVKWPNASQPTYTTPSIYTFTTVDAGTTWYGAQAGKAFG